MIKKTKNFYQPDLFGDSPRIEPQKPELISQSVCDSSIDGYRIKQFLLDNHENLKLSYVDNIEDNSLDCRIIEKVVGRWKV